MYRACLRLNSRVVGRAQPVGRAPDRCAGRAGFFDTDLVSPDPLRGAVGRLSAERRARGLGARGLRARPVGRAQAAARADRGAMPEAASPAAPKRFGAVFVFLALYQ